MTRTPRLPNAQRRVAPGQMTLDGAMLRAQRRYPDAIAWRQTSTGRVLSLLSGGAPAPAAPVAAIARRRAA